MGGIEAGDADGGIGPGQGGEKYDRIVDNPFVRVSEKPLSTFSIDVDTASYSKVRQYLTQYNQLPRPDAVRIEELLNYFRYEYESPTSDQHEPFATHVAVSQCPWNDEHRLVRLALKGRDIQRDVRPSSNLVLLIDSSGSMKKPNKLPLLKRGMQLLLKQLNEKDRIAIVAYAGSAGLVLDSTPATESNKIIRASAASRPAAAPTVAKVCSWLIRLPETTSSKAARTASCCAPMATSMSV